MGGGGREENFQEAESTQSLMQKSQELSKDCKKASVAGAQGMRDGRIKDQAGMIEWGLTILATSVTSGIVKCMPWKWDVAKDFIRKVT